MPIRKAADTTLEDFWASELKNTSVGIISVVKDGDNMVLAAVKGLEKDLRTMAAQVISDDRKIAEAAKVLAKNLTAIERQTVEELQALDQLKDDVDSIIESQKKEQAREEEEMKELKEQMRKTTIMNIDGWAIVANICTETLFCIIFGSFEDYKSA